MVIGIHQASVFDIHSSLYISVFYNNLINPYSEELSNKEILITHNKLISTEKYIKRRKMIV